MPSFPLIILGFKKTIFLYLGDFLHEFVGHIVNVDIFGKRVIPNTETACRAISHEDKMFK